MSYWLISDTRNWNVWRIGNWTASVSAKNPHQSADIPLPTLKQSYLSINNFITSDLKGKRFAQRNNQHNRKVLLSRFYLYAQYCTAYTHRPSAQMMIMIKNAWNQSSNGWNISDFKIWRRLRDRIRVPLKNSELILSPKI